MPIYFAAGFYDDPKDPNGKKVFEIVRPFAPGALPYLTYSPNGLRATAHHASLYRLSDDGERAVLANLRCLNVGAGETAKLTESQKEAIRQAIEANHFFE
ncbi:MAG: hypothetical protein E7449_01075 [Ruminococcaceae bacterium]|nr:hypothetical protein [Oscillospiraceae bacterium]